MVNYKIHIDDRNYTSWQIYDANNFKKVDIQIDPVKEKLFANDIFFLDKNNNATLVHSTVRTGGPIPGVLVLCGNKSYGRQAKNMSGMSGIMGAGEINTRQPALIKNGKLLYKCIPDDMRLPPFLVPYEIKNVGFSKVYTNLYVTFTFNDWFDKHPSGTLSCVIGPVDILDNFYEYQLYCKSLNASIQKFQKATTKALEKGTHETFFDTIRVKYPSIQDRTDQNIWHIFTIDPPKSVDFDDGFSIIDAEDGIQQLSIYISNVTIWMDILNLWDSFSRRISTIYLPDKKRPMLPTILSDCLCSLQEKVTRVAFVMDLFIKDDKIVDIKFSNCFIKVFKNYRYEEPDLLSDKKYYKMLETTKQLSQKFRYINNVRNSHEMVCYLMVMMNYYCAKEFLINNSGVFRSTIMKREINVPNTIPEEVAKFIKIWNSASGQYIDGSEIMNEVNIRHEMLDIEAYVHITSPIRRLVDLLNIIKFQQISGIIHLSENSVKFYNTWLSELDYINTTMRSIRKVQCDCSLLDLCANSPAVMEKEYDGYLFDKIMRNDGLYQYIVFLPELKLSSRINLRENYENYENKKFKLFLFNDEENFKKKIRLHLNE